MAAIIKGTARQDNSVQRVSEGAEVYLRMLREGSISIADFILVCTLEGYGFGANFGTVTTPITPGATANIDVTKPFAWVSCPATHLIIPTEVSVYMEAYGTNAQFQVNAQIGTGGSRTSGGTAVTPANLRSDRPRASVCTAYTGNATPVFVGSTTNVHEFWRDGCQFAITKTTASATAAALDPEKFGWELKNGMAPVIGYGASQIAVHQGSQAGTGFVILKWVELPL